MRLLHESYRASLKVLSFVEFTFAGESARHTRAAGRA
jgi:hypothetical protein